MPGPLIVRLLEMTNSPLVSVIWPSNPIGKAIVSPLFAWAISSRSEPGPRSATLVTVHVGAVTLVGTQRSSSVSSRGRKVTPLYQGNALMGAILDTWHEFGGTKVPRVAVVDWKEVATRAEFDLVCERLQRHGIPARSVASSRSRTARPDPARDRLTPPPAARSWGSPWRNHDSSRS